jgi:two-component system chemotaxis sensor kinase CheA
MSSTRDRYTELFLDEAAEHIENLNTNLLLLEKDRSDTEIINEIFRSAHTLKSSAAFVGLESLSHLAHKMEDLLQKIREGSISVNTDLVNLLFACLDRIKQAVAVIQEGRLPDDTYSDLISKIEQYQGNAREESTTQHRAPVLDSELAGTPAKDAPIRRFELTTEQQRELARLAGSKSIYHGFVSIDEDAPMKNMRFLLLLNKLGRIGNIYLSEPSAKALEEGVSVNHLLFIYYGDEKKDSLFKTCQIDMVEEVHITELEINGDHRQLTAQVERKSDSGLQDAHLKTRNIKVSSEKIDYLLNNVGELVITNSGLLKIYEDLLAEFGESTLLSELKSRIDQAGRIARDLQTGIMKTRMIPIGIVFQRFNRPVRDLALSLGKQVEFVTEGEDTELDKNIIDALNDPLLHLVRNALDHGIETAEERIRAGKNPVGRLTLKAYQSGNSIYVEIRDDGRGLNRQKILEKAIEQGLVAPGTIPGDDEVYNMIFLPGFSTATRVSDLSGRGVGMNVVRKMVTEFKGTVQIQNTPGQGCAFILTFPLTLAIISAILVRVMDEDYAFPLSDVVETIRVTKSEITRLQGKSIINLRNEIVPVFRLGQLMGNPAAEQNEEFPVVIASVSDRKIGYIVDQMIGKKEIVIKSLEQNYRRVDGLIGACLMGDGSIVMVLDVHSLMEIANRTGSVNDADKSLLVLNAIRRYNERVRELALTGRKLRRREQTGKHDSQPALEVKVTNAEDTSARPVAAKAPPGAEQSNAPETSAATVTSSVIVKPASEEAQPQSDDSSTVVTRLDDAPDAVSQEKVEQFIELFHQEKEERIDQGLRIFSPADDRAEDLEEDDYNRLYSVINTGMINGGLVLSQLLGVTVEVTVPEFQTIHYDELQNYLPDSDLIGVFLETEGDFRALIMLVFDEETGYNAAGELMGISVKDRNKQSMSIEDVESVLCELTNIVGSSLLNEMANRTGLAITPTVPHFVHGKASDLLSYVDAKEKTVRDSRFIYISTDFLREDTELLGRMFMLPNRPDLLGLVKRIQ